MFQIIATCTGVPAAAGSEAAADITAEFREHRPWHAAATCTWEADRLVLVVQNDFDGTGAAVADEFSDAISAYIAEPFDGSINIESVTELPAGA
jgi:hypothetical protein